MPLDLAHWMQYLDPKEKVIDLYIPASHDASAYVYGNIIDDTTNEGLGAICQSTNYAGQLAAGSRYFDMRITWNGEFLVMKHSVANFERFDTVLDELLAFTGRHDTEILFLDLDFDQKYSDKIKELLKIKIGTDKFVTKHARADGTYNSDLTWGDLKSEGKPFVVIWQAGCDSGEPWAPQAQNIRYNEDDDFNKKNPQEILNYLDGKLGEWNKQDKLFVTQLINTPGFSPIDHPVSKDKEAAPLFNAWVKQHSNGQKLGIVKRDFVNSSWNHDAIEWVVKLNRFTQPPAEIQLGDPVHYLDKIRLRTPDGRYVSVDVQPPFSPNLSLVTLVDVPTSDSEFLLRHYKYSSNWGFPYSGNWDADSDGANGNLRLVHFDTRSSGNVGNDTVLSQLKTNQNQIWWGIGWGPADNWETFLAYDPDDMDNSQQIYYGGKLLIRTLDKLFWQAVKDTNGWHIYAKANTHYATDFIIEKAPKTI